MDRGATRMVAAGMTAAGFDVTVDGTVWEITPRTPWRDYEGGLVDGDDIPALDAEGVAITVELGGQMRVARAVTTSAPTRIAIDTAAAMPFTVPATPGTSLRLRIQATCTHRADGRLLRTTLKRTLVDGYFDVPSDVHDFGCTGTGLVPHVHGGDAVYAFLHLASVDGSRRYVAAHLTFTVVT